LGRGKREEKLRGTAKGVQKREAGENMFDKEGGALSAQSLEGSRK